MHQPANGIYSGRMLGIVGLIVASILSSACASKAVEPTAALIEAREAIASAEKNGARQYAPAELDEAKQKLVAAERAVSNEDMLEAERLAQESAVVAELASALSASAKAAEINRQMHRSSEALDEEMRRTGDQQ